MNQKREVQRLLQSWSEQRVLSVFITLEYFGWLYQPSSGLQISAEMARAFSVCKTVACFTHFLCFFLFLFFSFCCFHGGVALTTCNLLLCYTWDTFIGKRATHVDSRFFFSPTKLGKEFLVDTQKHRYPKRPMFIFLWFKGFMLRNFWLLELVIFVSYFDFGFSYNDLQDYRKKLQCFHVISPCFILVFCSNYLWLSYNVACKEFVWPLPFSCEQIAW